MRWTHGVRWGRKRVARLMRAMGLCGVHRRRTRGITRRDPRRPVDPRPAASGVCARCPQPDMGGRPHVASMPSPVPWWLGHGGTGPSRSCWWTPLPWRCGVAGQGPP
ncbi:transposase [Thermaerobacter litoralis]